MTARVDPRLLAAALSVTALVLALTGVALIGSEILVSHPEAVRFAAEGRRREGEVYRAAGLPNSTRRIGPKGTRIGVEDPELGPQVIDLYGDLPIHKRVPVLCLTAAGHCLSAHVVEARLAAWPLTPLILAGAGELALAAALFGVGQYRRRQRP